MVRRFSAEPSYTPTSVAKAIRFLEEERVLSRQDAGVQRRVAGFHNVLVHEYVSVSIVLIYSILREGLHSRAVLLASKPLEEASRRGIDP